MNENKYADSYREMSHEVLATKIAEASFFHDMSLRSGLRTGSWVYGEDLPPNYHLWPILNYLNQIDLSGHVCMDVGTYDGMTAFAMADAGASAVHATCQYDLARFRMVRAYQGYDNLAYYPNTDIEWLSENHPSGSVDLMVMSAMLHHLTSPLDAFLEARRMLKREGLFLVESIVIDGDDATLSLNSELSEPVYGAPTLWVPTVNAVRGMLRFASFDILSESRLLGGRKAREKHFDRVTFLTRARKPSDLSVRTEKAKEIHTASPIVGGLDFSKLDQENTAPSTVQFEGEASQNINIWLDHIEHALQPSKQDEPYCAETAFSVGSEKQFFELVERIPDGAFRWQDVYLLGARYQGEEMPDGMQWGIKQFGNLHALSYIQDYGLSGVLEIGPGFNLYFPNHLPDWCDYTALDDEGFYDSNVLQLANAARSRGEVFSGLLGDGKHQLPPGSFDACISISVLEHVPRSDIPDVCKDMFRLLRPGGYALHSIDLTLDSIEQEGRAWLEGLRNAGFEIDDASIDGAWSGQMPGASASDVFLEPLSIRSRFYSGYRRTIWGETDVAERFVSQMATILVAARKP